MLHGRGQKVCGGWVGGCGGWVGGCGGWVCKPSSVFSFGFDQAEQNPSPIYSNQQWYKNSFFSKSYACVTFWNKSRFSHLIQIVTIWYDLTIVTILIWTFYFPSFRPFKHLSPYEGLVFDHRSALIMPKPSPFFFCHKKWLNKEPFQISVPLEIFWPCHASWVKTIHPTLHWLTTSYHSNWIKIC